MLQTAASCPVEAPGPSRSSRTLTVLFLAISFVLSLGILSVRNIYDDEMSSLDYVRRSVWQIIATANSQDVHPPGMYLLAHFAYRAIPSPRWMTLFDLAVLYAGLGLFAFAVAPLFASTRGRVCFLLLATLHPQLLMWGNTIRWYGWWTGLALAALVVGLQPAQRAATLRLTYGRAALLGLLLAGLFYLSYITLIFAVALAGAMLLRYGGRPWKQYAAALALWLALIAPQLHALAAVHAADSAGQRSGIALSLARLVEATCCSEAFLPWHPLAILTAVAFLALGVAGVRRGYGLLRPGAAGAVPERGIASLAVFALAFFALVAGSGLGGKPRNGLLLAPALAPLAAMLVETLRPVSAQYALLGLFGLWSAVGAEHLLRRGGLAKSNMDDHPEEVVAYVRGSAGADCPVVVTYDAVLTLSLSSSEVPRLLLLTPVQNAMYGRAQRFDAAECRQMELYLVTSYAGGLGSDGSVLAAEMEAEGRALPGPLLVRRFGFDPDAARKRRLAFISGASHLPDYRYVVTSAAIAPSRLEGILRELPHFAPADGVSVPAASQ